MIHRQAYKQKADDLSRNVINSNYWRVFDSNNIIIQ